MATFKHVKYIVIIALSFLPYLELYAQNTLSLSDALRLGEQNNLSLKINDKKTNLAKQDLNKSRGIFLPQINLSHTAIGTTNPLMAFGSKLNQEILTQQDFNPSLLNDPEYIRDYSTLISVKQPLINIDGVYQRQAAKLMVDYQTKQNAFSKKHIRLEIKKAYMQLQVAIQQVRVLQQAEKTALANLKYATDYLKQGYLQKSDYLDVEVRVADVKHQLQSAHSNVLNTSNYLSVLLNLDSYEQIIPSDKLQPDLIDEDSTYILSNTREDIEAMKIGQKAQHNLHKANKMQFIPRLNVFGNLELHDDQIFGTKAKGYLIGAQLSWDIFKGGEQWTNIQKSKIELDKTALDIEQYEQQSQLEINKTQRALKDAKNRLILSQKSVVQSQEALKIRNDRFKHGLEKTTDLLMAETKYAQRQLEYLNTIYNYNYTLAYLKLLTN